MMNNNPTWAALGIGVAAGLRSMTAPAVVSRAASDGRLDVRDTPLAFIGSGKAAALTAALALGEYGADLLPAAPNRTDPGPLAARIVSGGLSGAALCAARKESAALGAVLGGIGAVVGTFGGYHARKYLVKRLGVPDACIAIPEDLVAIRLAQQLVTPR
jgi:uncharacterized membrane protein